LKKIDENKTEVTNFALSDLKLNQTLVNTTLGEVARTIKNLKGLLK
jgi:hypothetical protein